MSTFTNLSTSKLIIKVRDCVIFPFQIVLLVVAVRPGLSPVLHLDAHHRCQMGHGLLVFFHKHHLVSPQQLPR